MSLTKNVLLNWYSSMKKKMRKMRMIFWHKKFTLKVKFWHFGTAYYTNLQNSIISFEYVCWLLVKTLSNFVSLPWKIHNPYCHTVHAQLGAILNGTKYSGIVLHSWYLAIHSEFLTNLKFFQMYDTFYFSRIVLFSKVINTKYSKHWLSTLAHTIDCVCSKILNHGLNHGLLFPLFKFFGWKNILN